ncbi:MAG: pirin family protein [Gammaproteobacteria bacterium]|nr:pirin family protein [Gammaproteobacteria bacterium]
MSESVPQDPAAGEARSNAALDTVIVPRARDLGGFEVRRALPARERQMIGPFIFFDQMGPASLAAGEGMDVRPHPHIGLSTLTYLFAGEVLHRDSLGNEIVIRPGELNWMTAGRGIAHSERTPEGLRGTGSELFGIQSWVALSARDEERAPEFVHHDADELPVLSGEGIEVRVIAGTVLGATSPVETSSPMLYADVTLAPGAAFPLDAVFEERAVYVTRGQVAIAGDSFEAGRLLVFRPGDAVTIRSDAGCRLLALGGDPMDGRRYIWWNFVSSSRERIEQAKADWQAGRFDPVPNETEFIPLPGAQPKTVDYP